MWLARESVGLSLLVLAVLLAGSFAASFKGEVSPITANSVPEIQTGNASSRGGNHTCPHPQWKGLSKFNIIRFFDNCEAKVLHCYCLTPTNTNVIDPRNVHHVIGHCLQGCFISERYVDHYNTSLLSDKFCSTYNRMGILCGACKSGYGTPVYSFSLKCVECNKATFWKHLLYYVVIAYGPLTIFLTIMIVFTVSMNSAPFYGWIFVCQICSSSVYMRVVTRLSEIHHRPKVQHQVFGTLYGLWSLDFFRTVYDPFCLHPTLTTLQVMSLNYIIAAYPLVAIVVMYTLVHLYSHGCRPVVVMCRPLHYCCMHFRHQLNIRTSLVDAFGTFFSLSYVKFLSTTVDLLMPTKVWKEDGSVSCHSYSDGTQLFFRGNHLPFAILGMAVFIVFNLLPILLLLLYSFPQTQCCIRCVPQALQNAIYPFMDNILSCYKDGTNGTNNCRYFSVVYHIARMLIWSSIMWTESILFYPVAAIIVIICSMCVTLVRPYKSAMYNAFDTFILLSLALCIIGNTALIDAAAGDPQNMLVIKVIFTITLSIPTVYILLYVGYKLKIIQMIAFLWSKSFTTILRVKEVGVCINDAEDSALLTP